MLVSSLSFLPHCEILCSWDCILLHLSVPRKMSIIPNTWSEPFRKSPFISQLLRVNTVSIYKWIWWGPWLYKCLCWKSIALSKYVSLCSLQRPHQYFVDACEAVLFPILQGRELRLREVRSGAQVTSHRFSLAGLSPLSLFYSRPHPSNWVLKTLVIMRNVNVSHCCL